MTLNDPLASMFSNIMNCERTGKKELLIKPSSTFMKHVLHLLQEKQYVGEFKEVKVRGGQGVQITLIAMINNCGVIKPRSAVQVENWTKYEKRYLPARGFGILLVSTPKGLMTHIEAKEKRLGGRLIAYCY